MVAKHTLLAEDDRSLRRTVADALEVLRQETGFTDADSAAIQLAGLRPLSGKDVWLTQVQFEAREGTYGVSLPSAYCFSARTASGQRESFDMRRLHGAEVSGTGQVRLADGTLLSAVEVLPARLPLEPSQLDWTILRHTLSLIDPEARSTIPLADRFPSEVGEAIPDARVLDFGKLTSLLNEVQVPYLKVIAAHIATCEPDLNISQQKISDTLAAFGIRPIRRRRR